MSQPKLQPIWITEQATRKVEKLMKAERAAVRRKVHSMKQRNRHCIEYGIACDDLMDWLKRRTTS